MIKHAFRRATDSECTEIWRMLEQAILRRKADGSSQWQDGYPNPEVVRNDLDRGIGFVLTEGDEIVGYSAVLINDEPQYASIEGEWLTKEDFVVVHRIVVSESHLGKGLAGVMLEHVEAYATGHHIYSVKVDTNFDNIAMQKTFLKRGYTFCGKVYFRGSERLAFEKVLKRS